MNLSSGCIQLFRIIILHTICPKAKGLLWLLRDSNISPGFIKPGEIDRPCSIKATINPKILTGENNYLAAATVDYLEGVEEIFNNEAKKISYLGRI